MRRLAIAIALAVLASTRAARGADDDDESPPPRSQRQREPEARVGFGIEGGYAWREIYTVPYYGPAADVEIGVARPQGGSDRPGLFGGLTIHGTWGQSANGLPVREGALGGRMQLYFGILGVGGGAHFTWIDISRATNGGQLASLAFGVEGALSVDLVPLDDGHAVYLAARPAFDFFFGRGNDGGGIVWGGSAAIGLRW